MTNGMDFINIPSYKKWAMSEVMHTNNLISVSLTYTNKHSYTTVKCIDVTNHQSLSFSLFLFVEEKRW